MSSITSTSLVTSERIHLKQIDFAVAEITAGIVLGIVAGLLLWGSHFATSMVHDQLAAQHITFPAAGTPALSVTEFPSLQKYGGKTVTDGPAARAYADVYIASHLTDVAGGKTYSEVSSLARTDRAAATAATGTPQFAALNAKATTEEGQVQTLFRGETVRGLLLFAWGWWLIGKIALWAGIAIVVVAIGLLILAGYRSEIGRPDATDGATS
jgi:hypothetical protein